MIISGARAYTHSRGAHVLTLMIISGQAQGVMGRDGIQDVWFHKLECVERKELENLYEQDSYADATFYVYLS